jgi:HD-GYP domain-containing protein (c-di-GMP phosphodiesterase class II)
MQLLALVQGQVRLGEPLPWGVRDAVGNLLLARGQVMNSAAQIEQLLERGATVDIEELRAVAEAEAARLAAASARPPTLFGQWEQALWQLDRLLRSANGAAPQPAAEGELPFVERVDALARQIMALTLRDPDIAIYLTVRQDPKRLTIYALAHSVHCAMVSLLMARRLAWDASRTLTLVRAALTMNIGILDLQGRMAAQSGAPSTEQMDQIRVHPAQAVELLTAAGVNDALWLETVAQHHERPDGSGYPAGLREVGELASVLRHIDVFMAKLAPRALRKPIGAQLAARQMFQDSGGGSVPAAIIKEFGIYPPGEYVQLKSGEFGVVVRRGANAGTPQVACVTDRKGAPSVTTRVCDTAVAEFAIASLPADKTLAHRVPPERLYGLQE